MIYPLTQFFTTRLFKCGPLQCAVFYTDYIPAKRIKNFLNTCKEPFPHNAIKRLAIIINNPPAVAQVIFPAFLQGFINITFVKLRITDKSNHAAGIEVFSPLLIQDKVLNNGSKSSYRDTKPDGSGGKIHIINIL